MTPQAIIWPTVKIGGRNKLSGRTLTFRVAFAAHYLLQRWCPNALWTDFDWAAASAGEFDKQGDWHSLGIPPLELADILSRDQEPGKENEWVALIQAAAVEAVGKVNPGPVPLAPAKPGVTTAKTDGSETGRSELAEAV